MLRDNQLTHERGSLKEQGWEGNQGVATVI